MGKVVGRIVLTGGPGGGKTSSVTKIIEKFGELNYAVLVVPESATSLINSGIKPFGKNALSSIDFQRIILKYQLMKEQLYEEAALYLPDNTNCIIIYDRGLLDNKAYIGQEAFNELLKEQNLSEIDMMDRYDKVIHLVTPADGAREHYTLENNKARTETIDEAIAIDKRTRDAWMGKSNLEIIDNYGSFDDKMYRVINSIKNTIGIPEIIQKQRKYLVDLDKSIINFDMNKTTMIKITQSYIDNDNFEIRLRKRELNGDSTFFLTKQVKQGNGESRIKINRRISYEDYLNMISNNKCFSLQKDRYSFNYKKQYFRLDKYDDNSAILEIEPTRKEIVLPPTFKILGDVTDNPNYSNYNIAKEYNKVKKLVG